MTITPFDHAKIQHAELVALLELLVDSTDEGMRALGNYGQDLAVRHQPRALLATAVERGLYGHDVATCSHGGAIVIPGTAQSWPCADFQGLADLMQRLAELFARKLCQAFTHIVLGDPLGPPLLVTCYLEPHGPETRHRAEVTHNGATVDFEWPNRVEPEPKPYRASFTWGGVWAEAQQWMEQLPTKVMGFSTSVVDGPPPLRMERSAVRDRLHVCTHDKGCRLLDWGQAVTWDGRGFTVSGGAPSGVQHR